MWILIAACILAVVILWISMKMAGICSRREEREWRDG